MMKNLRRLKDTLAGRAMWLLASSSGLIVVIMAFGLFQRSKPILAIKPLTTLLFSSTWQPFKGDFGFYPFIAGTLWVTAVAMILAVPLSLLTAIYLSEYANRRFRDSVKPIIDLLAGISPVVYGVWGVLVVVPVIKDYVMPIIGTKLGFIPIFRATNPTGFSVLAGGSVLAIMVFPIIISVAEEVLSTVPGEMREVSLALGATKWQTLKYAVLRKASPGIIAAIILGLSRAFGETMAVLMVVGNVPQVPRSVFDPAYPLPALIANNYGEMMSIPLYDSALLLAALVLLVVTLFFNIVAWAILLRIERRLV